jgi:phospholipid/cholesterol/gamma-HCH transport system permease protein
VASRSAPASFPGAGALRETGRLFGLGLDVAVNIFRRPFQTREFIQQCWFVASVTILPTALVAIPFGAVIALQLGSLTKQLGAQSFTGAASVLAIIQQASPLVTALLVAGAGGSAICADIGARTIREEIDAMVSVVGVLGGYFFNVIMQGGTPGAYLSSFNALAQLPDLWIGEIKALIFGFIAGVVAAYRGLHPAPGPKGVGEAVNQSVVITFLLLFFVNFVLTTVYLQLIPSKIG